MFFLLIKGTLSQSAIFLNVKELILLSSVAIRNNKWHAKLAIRNKSLDSLFYLSLIVPDSTFTYHVKVAIQNNKWHAKLAIRNNKWHAKLAIQKNRWHVK